jgi:hypothetical protein
MKTTIVVSTKLNAVALFMVLAINDPEVSRGANYPPTNLATKATKATKNSFLETVASLVQIP